MGLRVRYGCVLGVLIAVYLAAPDSWGGIAFLATAVLGLLAFAIGPLVHRPANKRPWQWLTAAGALFLAGLLLRLELIELPGVIGEPDLWAFGGYACTVPFLTGLLRRTHVGRDTSLWLDTAAVTTGSALIGWVMNVAPQLSGENLLLRTTLVNATYPVMDALLLALTLQLAFRRGSQAPALQAAVAGMSAMLIGDLAYTFIWAADPGAINPYVNVSYLVAYACLGLMAGHPSMRELSDVDVPAVPGTSRARLVVIFIAMITPASIPLLTPTRGTLDSVVRAVIMSVFGALVFLRLLGTVRALQQAEARAHHRGTHDSLTNLPNRVALLTSLEAHLTRTAADNQSGWTSVVFVDCDHFKQINDSWGHLAGDEVLVQVAQRLRSMSDLPDNVNRVGGDEFVVLMDTSEPEQAIDLARRIMAAFTEPIVISSDRSTMLTLSIGIAQTSRPTDVTAQDLVRDADLALYEAKSDGRSRFAVYDHSMDERVVRRHALADAMRGALERGEIHVVFQPIRGGENYADLVGWEALARWDHPRLGSISPVEFIPIAEDTGLIVEIGAFVLRAACEQLSRWQEQLDRADLHVSVNVSSVQLARADMVELVGAVLSETRLPPDSLWLEITESIVLERTHEALSALGVLAEQGIKICLDDFGTGFSSLSYLQDFTVHILKVDRAFVRNLVDNRRDRELTRSMIDVATALGLDGVVAEGVETEEQAQILTELGCTLAQGFLYGRPAVPAQALREAQGLLARPGARPGPGPRPGGQARQEAGASLAPVPQPRQSDEARAPASAPLGLD